MKINRAYFKGKNLEGSIDKALGRANDKGVTKIISIIEDKFLFWHKGIYVVYLVKDEFYDTDTIRGIEVE